MAPPDPAPRQRKNSRRSIRWIAALLSLVLSLGLAELGLRIAGYKLSYLNALRSFHQPDPVAGYRGKPNFTARYHTADFDVLIAHDERGFRRHETPPPKRLDAPTVHAFGDSFTWGWGVEQGEVYSDVLAREMPNFRVLNWGLNASGTVQQYAIFRQRVLPDLKPGDVVIVAFFQNDYGDNVSGWIPTTIKKGQPVSQPVKRLGGSLVGKITEASRLANLAAYSCNVLSQRWLTHRAAVVSTSAAVAVATGARSEAATGTTIEYQVAKHFLRSFQKDCETKKARFYGVYIPTPLELDEIPAFGPAEAAYDERLRKAFFEMTADAGVPTIDLLPGFLAARKSGRFDRLTIARDGHWNAAGHQCAAQILKATLEKEPAPLAVQKERRIQ